MYKVAKSGESQLVNGNKSTIKLSGPRRRPVTTIASTTKNSNGIHPPAEGDNAAANQASSEKSHHKL